MRNAPNFTIMNWREYPMARLLLPLAAGVVAGETMAGHQQWAWAALAVSLALLAYWQKAPARYRRRWWFGAALNLFLFCLGLSLVDAYDERRLPGHFSRRISPTAHCLLIGRVEALEPASNSLKATLAVRAVAQGGSQVRPAGGRLLAYFDITAPSRTLGPGDVALLRCKVQPVPPPLNPKAFDYARYLHFRNIHYQAFIREGEWQLLGHCPGFFSQVSRLRGHCINILRAFLPTENEFAVAAALLLGYKAGLSEEVRNAYAQTGAMHVLAVSGLHVGIVQILVAYLLGLMPFSGRTWRFARLALLLLCVWGFALLAGASPSVLRAAAMFSFLSAGQAFRRHTNIYNTLAASAFCLLCTSPYLLFSPGFQLSYLAVLGIVYFQPRFYRLWYIRNRGGDYLWKLVSVSLAAQLTTLPISLYYFHQFPVYFWLSGLVVVPAAAFILLSGLSLLALHAVPLLGWLAGQVLYWLVWGVNALIFLIRQLPGGLLEGVWAGPAVVALLYTMLAGIVAAAERRAFRWLLGAMAALLFVGILYNWQHWSWRKQEALAIYHIRGGTAIDLFDGQQAASFQSEGLEESSLLYAAQQYRWYRGAAELPVLALSDSGQGCHWRIGSGFLQFGRFRLAILQDGRLPGPSGRLAVDAVLLCNNAGLSINDLAGKLDAGIVIIDGSNAYRKVQSWRRECQELGIPCHYTGTDGAWILK